MFNFVFVFECIENDQIFTFKSLLDDVKNKAIFAIRIIMKLYSFASALDFQFHDNQFKSYANNLNETSSNRIGDSFESVGLRDGRKYWCVSH